MGTNSTKASEVGLGSVPPTIPLPPPITPTLALLHVDCQLSTLLLRTPLSILNAGLTRHRWKSWWIRSTSYDREVVTATANGCDAKTCTASTHQSETCSSDETLMLIGVSSNAARGSSLQDVLKDKSPELDKSKITSDARQVL